MVLLDACIEHTDIERAAGETVCPEACDEAERMLVVIEFGRAAVIHIHGHDSRISSYF